MTEAGTKRKLFFGLFIFPLLIAVGMTVLLCAAVLLTHERETPETLVAAIKQGAGHKRWQKAFELSNELNRGAAIARPESLVQDIVHVLKNRQKYDARTRGFMALALSRLPSTASEEALSGALQDPDEEVRLYALWSLGVLGSRSKSAEVARWLESDSPKLRTMAAYVLGVLGTPAEIPALESRLADVSSVVRWNTALSLARLGRTSGAAVLRDMLSREALRNEKGLEEGEAEEILLNAIKGLTLIRDKDSIKILLELSRHDPSLKVRQAAMDALSSLRGEEGVFSR